MRIAALSALLKLRRHKEDLAERALAATAQEILRCSDQIEQCRLGLAEIRDSRVREIQSAAAAAHYQSVDARHSVLLCQCAEAERELTKLTTVRAEQMSVYMLARCERESVSDLEKRSREALERAVLLREQKWNEDMFLARRVSNPDTTPVLEESGEPKGAA